MAINFALRGDAFDARFSRSGNTHGKWANTAGGATNPVLTASADPNVFGGSYINMAHATLIRCISYIGSLNFSATTNLTMMLRMIPRFTGAPGSTQVIMTSGVPGDNRPDAFVIYQGSAGAFNMFFYGARGELVTNAISANVTSFVSGTPVDLGWVLRRAQATAQLEFWINGVQHSTYNGTAVATALDPGKNPGLVVKNYGVGGIQVGNWDLNELVIWDTAEDLSVYAGRTAFVTVAAFNPLANIDPGIANVRSGTAYEIAGIDYTGTAVIPSLANTKIGVAGDGGTGTYDGSDRWTDPGASNVRSPVAYKANSTTNNMTGSAVIPSLANTKIGVAGDGGTGTYDGSDRWTDPGAANVRSPVAYKANSTTNNMTGSAVIPSLANTKIGVAGDGGVGTYDGSDRWTALAAANVRAGTAYKSNSTTNNMTGVLVAAAAATTKIGVLADDGVGTYYGQDRWDSVPGAAVDETFGAYRSNSVTPNVTPTLVVPDEDTVELNTIYGPDSDLMGSYYGQNYWDSVPGAAVDETFGAYRSASLSPNITPTLVVPDEDEVALGIVYGPDSSLTGTFTAEDYWTAIPGNKVDESIGEYKVNSLTPNVTASLHVYTNTNPGTENVLEGVTWIFDDDEQVGELSITPFPYWVGQIVENEILVGQVGARSKFPIPTEAPMSPSPFTIFTGDSKTMYMRVINTGCNADPLDLTNCTDIVVALPNADGTFAQLKLSDGDVEIVAPAILGKFAAPIESAVSELLNIGEFQNVDVTFTIAAKEFTVRFFQALSVFQRD